MLGTIKIEPDGSNVSLKAEISKDVIAKLDKAARKKIKEKQGQ